MTTYKPKTQVTSSVEAHPTDRLSVLIVDDAPDNAELLAELVASYGHRVRIADRGQTALDLLEKELADLVFLDLSLPDIEGYEVASSIRARFGDRCQIAAMTGYSGNNEREAALHAGCDVFVVKPFQLPQVRDLLEGCRRAMKV